MASKDKHSQGAQNRRESASEGKLYQRKRWSLRQRREAEDHAQFDPRPVTDDDWTVPKEGDEPSLARISPPELVGNVISDLVTRQGWSTRLQAAVLFNQWQEICGDDLAAHCEPVRLAGGILVLRVESQIWATQLRYCVGDITQNIQTKLGIDSIRDVRIVVGPLEKKLP